MTLRTLLERVKKSRGYDPREIILNPSRKEIMDGKLIFVGYDENANSMWVYPDVPSSVKETMDKLFTAQARLIRQLRLKYGELHVTNKFEEGHNHLISITSSEKGYRSDTPQLIMEVIQEKFNVPIIGYYQTTGDSITDNYVVGPPPPGSFIDQGDWYDFLSTLPGDVLSTMVYQLGGVFEAVVESVTDIAGNLWPYILLAVAVLGAVIFFRIR